MGSQFKSDAPGRRPEGVVFGRNKTPEAVEELIKDPILIKHFQEQRIHIEMCPTSNVKTGSVNRIEEHPAKLAKELGLNFSINTDDPGAFGYSMESEYELLAETFGFQEEDFEKIRDNAFKSRFGSRQKVTHYTA